jgi:hypothetical protein
LLIKHNNQQPQRGGRNNKNGGGHEQLGHRREEATMTMWWWRIPCWKKGDEVWWKRRHQQHEWSRGWQWRMETRHTDRGMMMEEVWHAITLINYTQWSKTEEEAITRLGGQQQWVQEDGNQRVKEVEGDHERESVRESWWFI